MRLLPTSRKFFQQHQYVAYLVLFVIALSLFGWLQADATFADPDSFYHAKMGQLLLRQSSETQFPWLSATNLRFEFTDHHFLYHLLLGPFVNTTDPLIGIKVATVLFASLAIVSIYALMRNLRIKGAFWYVLFLLTINPFLFRINLAKAQPLVLLALMVSLIFLFNRKPLPLLFMMFVYSWLYAGWPVLLGLTVIYLLITQLRRKKLVDLLAVRRRLRKVTKQNFALLLSVLIGAIAGIFFSPYFPGNINFVWEQAVNIGIFNYQGSINVGGEWYGYPIIDLMRDASLFLVLYLFSLAAYIYKWRKQTTHNHVLFAFSLVFLLLTLKSRRNIEYLVPFGVIFSASVITTLLDSFKFKLRWHLGRRALPLVSLGLVLILSPIFHRDVNQVKIQYQSGRPFNQYAAAAIWLRNNTNPGEIVFHSDWDEFPHLFYYNDHNYYIVGLDPSFLFRYDAQLHQEYVDITTGVQTDKLYEIISKNFGASYVFVDRIQNSVFDAHLASNIFFEKIYEDQEARVYRLSQ